MGEMVRPPHRPSSCTGKLDISPTWQRVTYRHARPSSRDEPTFLPSIGRIRRIAAIGLDGNGWLSQVGTCRYGRRRSILIDVDCGCVLRSATVSHLQCP